ncbi:MAG: hypothetical protein Q4D55_10605 [Eubacteriales bacterium]|nr:hypothetical protein [Eubacteriales bacterium]
MSEVKLIMPGHLTGAMMGTQRNLGSLVIRKLVLWLSALSLIKKDEPSRNTVQAVNHTLIIKEVLTAKHRDFVYVGAPAPELNEQEHAAFLLNIQKSILLSLEKRQLLTRSQKQRCTEELEKQYSKKSRSQA